MLFATKILKIGILRRLHIILLFNCTLNVWHKIQTKLLKLLGHCESVIAIFIHQTHNIIMYVGTICIFFERRLLFGRYNLKLRIYDV